MPVQVTIDDSVIREWCLNVGLDVGSRGRLASSAIEEFTAFARMQHAEKVEWLTSRLGQANLKIAELKAQHSEDEAIMAAYRGRVQGLERELASTRAQRDAWRSTAVGLALVQHSQD